MLHTRTPFHLWEDFSNAAMRPQQAARFKMLKADDDENIKDCSLNNKFMVPIILNSRKN
jgi:hypothetical protein